MPAPTTAAKHLTVREMDLIDKTVRKDGASPLDACRPPAPPLFLLFLILLPSSPSLFFLVGDAWGGETMLDLDWDEMLLHCVEQCLPS